MPRSSRERNFSDNECLQLILAIKKYGKIIECKQHGKRYPIEKRQAAWQAVLDQFNTRTSQNRTMASIRAKWHNDKSNIRDYVQYLMTSQSRSGRNPDAIPKIRYMNLMIDIMGLKCPGVNIPTDVDEIPESQSTHSVTLKEEPMADLSFEEIVLPENNQQSNFSDEMSSSSLDSFLEISLRNQQSRSPPLKRSRISEKTPSLEHLNNLSPQLNGNLSNDTELQALQIQLIKKQIEVQTFMALEIQAKIARTKQLMEIDKEESKLRCEEISKRLHT